jgi:hypothetical protein
LASGRPAFEPSAYITLSPISAPVKPATRMGMSHIWPLAARTEALTITDSPGARGMIASIAGKARTIR